MSTRVKTVSAEGTERLYYCLCQHFTVSFCPSFNSVYPPFLQNRSNQWHRWARCFVKDTMLLKKKKTVMGNKIKVSKHFYHRASWELLKHKESRNSTGSDYWFHMSQLLKDSKMPTNVLYKKNPKNNFLMFWLWVWAPNHSWNESTWKLTASSLRKSCHKSTFTPTESQKSLTSWHNLFSCQVNASFLWGHSVAENYLGLYT